MMKFRSGIILVMFISIWGCSSANDKAIVLDASGKHPAGWVVALNGGNHPATYLSAPDKCKECHGADLKGGISAVSCFSSDRNGMSCHPQGPSGHPAGWSDPASHGARAKAAASGANGMSFCKNCHGADYRGTGASQKDCLRCHTTAPHPAKPWTGIRSHTTADSSNAPACAQCHTAKANLSPTGQAKLPATATIGSGGCFDNTLCHGVMGHSSDPQPWSLPANHGARAKTDPGTGGNTGLAACQQCHGVNFATILGGTNSCVSCHGVAAPHPTAANWRSTGTITHTNTGLNNAPVCASCHNSSSPKLAAPNLARFANSPAGSFNGGTPGCYNASMCHGDVTKTSNCDACHSTATTNPFKSMAGVTAVSDSKVGAHVKHLSASVQTPAYSINIACSECHTVPNTPAISGTHRNGSNDIVFGALAKSGSLTPTYSAGVCANTYCHGNTLDKPATAILSPTWNTPFLTGVAASDCAKCHGYPPATPTHTGKTPTQCITCHSHVNSAGTGFTDVSKHINGAIDASGSHVVPYLTHNALASASCLVANNGCHNTGTAASPYPAAAGTPPNCMSCHTLADPLVAGNGLNNCKSCHGTGGTGTAAAPTGTSWPNIRGSNIKAQHPSHEGSTCGDCHPGVNSTGRSTTNAAGSGSGENHGPNKNRLAGNTQTNSTQTVTGITPNSARGTGSTCIHSSLPNNACHSGPGQQTWTAP